MTHKIKNMLLFVGIFIVTLILVILVLSIIGNIFYEEDYWCDYDSCSQKAVNLFDDRCFNSEDLKCQPFLEFWNECQELKQEGEC